MANNSVGSGANAGGLIMRNYNSILGVDFSSRKDEIALYRSPEMVNMWRNYSNSSEMCIETRPGLDLVKEYDSNIYGMYYYTYANKKHLIVHVGENLYDDDILISANMSEHKSSFFVYGKKLYIMDTEHYFVYDGETLKEVEGYIPTTTISRSPIGGGVKKNDVNFLSPFRKNSFCSDGETLDYHLDVESYDDNTQVIVWINDEVVDNSIKKQVYDKNSYKKCKTNSNLIYWYDEENKTLYNSDYETIVNGEVHNKKGYIKYKKDNTYYWYDPTYKYVYDLDGNQTTLQISSLTKVSDTTTISQLSNITDFPYKEDPSTGVITFSTPPEKPWTDGEDNVIIQFKRTVKGYRETIENCTLVEIFDNRIFFSGNPNYPNRLFWCSLEDPEYCADTNQNDDGSDDSSIKEIVAGNNALWVLKEPSQTNTTIFYHNPAVDEERKFYPSVHSSINTGCVTKGKNFRDTIIFFSERGMEGISGDITTEQVISHKSTLIDSKLLSELNYKDMWLEEWQGYLLVFVDNKVYLADSSITPQISSHFEYEWFYWELENNVDFTIVDEGTLYICSGNSIYSLTNKSEDRKVNSVFCTIDDEFRYPQMQKITNKRGCVIDIDGNNINLYVKTDKTNIEKIGKFKIKKGRIIPKIKRKKWKSIQIRLESDEPFIFYSATLESYVTNYLKK